MSKHLLAVLAITTGAAALSGCVVVPAHPGYGYRYGRVAPPPAVVVTPAPYHRHRGWGYYPYR
jgi:hypothetical protein